MQQSEVLGSSERQLLYTVCCDESLAQSVCTLRQRTIETLRIVDDASCDVYQAARVICDSMSHYCDFLLASPQADQVHRACFYLILVTGCRIVL